MRWYPKKTQLLRAMTLSLLAGASAVPLLLSETAWAGQRQFLVILANSPKEFACLGGARNGTPCDVSSTNACPGGACTNARPLPDPQDIRNQYFDILNPSIRSFAEYWREISYGDITISGKVTDWVFLPWRIAPAAALPNDPRDLNGDGFISPADFPDLDPSLVDPIRAYSYGAGERFDTRFSMVTRDIGRPNDPNARVGADQISSVGTPVFTPGERFLDVNGNGVWEGFDEAANSMDWGRPGTPTGAPFNYDSPDDRADNPGPWIDLNGNGIPDNEPNCIYLPDSDNDGNPDCCPNGPGNPGCKPNEPNPCPATQVTGPIGDVFDCNGNGIPDACDISCDSQACADTGWTGSCETSKDQLPYTAQGTQCLPGDGDGIPDECQFLEPNTPCVESAPNCPPETPDVCCSVRTVCRPLPPDQARTTVPRCEFADVNGNGRLDIVEPFENFVHGVPFSRPIPFPSPDDPLWVPGSDYDAYVRNNYPGSNPNAVISRKTVRLIGGAHDPLNKITDARQRLCADGLPYRTIGSLSNVCPAGVHAEYNPPDKWFESDDPTVPHTVDWSKMGYVNGSFPSAGEPDWYQQAWRDRYGTTPPTWMGSVRRMVPRDVASRPTFTPNRGGVTGRGSGWSAGVDLTTAPILPDELNGIGQSVTMYDGPVEFDDLPSSKYHMAGDQQFGEVTSPFNDNIYGAGGVAAGPYATGLYGQHGRPAGNVVNMEWLTWRTTPPFNNGTTWDATYGTHPYAGPAGGNLGFRDYNLDGMLDLGECRVPGSENYRTGFYPWTKERLVEDTINILDEGLDFDDFVDPVTLDQLICVGGASDRVALPEPYASDGSVSIAGACSGIVLLPNGLPRFGPVAPSFTPIHNEDGLNDSVYQNSVFPKTPRIPQLCWNILFHNLVVNLDVENETGGTSTDFQTSLAAHEYLHSWQGFPDLYDYDLLDGTGVENCPIGLWDIMAKGGLVHPNPALKEGVCTRWIESVDLTTVLTPGVSKSVTLPAAEFVRDDSYFFLENEDRPGRFDNHGNYLPGERLYFWSGGSGFDERMPGDGVLILHADENSSNSDAIVLQQRNGIRPAYRIIQADGRNQLLSCINEGDAGDPWPGSSDDTHFACDTNPASEWYTENACTGLEVVDIAPDGNGSAVVTFNWTPTSVPSLKFVDPPGGVSVGTPPGPVTYNVRTEATDVYGGTWIRFFSTSQETDTPTPATGTLIKMVRKTTPGTNEQALNWNLAGVPDGRYFLFADLVPDQGADGRERKLTTVRAGRNNQGTAKLETGDVTVNVTTVSGTTVTNQGTSRSETWSIRCVDANAGKWFVGSSLTQPLPAEEPSAALCAANPTRCATTGTQYTSLAGAVKFTIREGTGSSPKGALGDTFTFTTTGITAPSAAVTIRNGQIREDPTAVIDAAPLSGPPGLEVKFDARRSVDPNGQPLTFAWTFGDGSTGTGVQVSHTYPNGGTYTVTLRATNPANGRFGEASVDIEVTNNSPNAVIQATPVGGQGPLTVKFNATQSSDMETDADQLIYQWTYGDGGSANDAGLVDAGFREVEHTYLRVNSNVDSTNCTTACPCTPTGRTCTVSCPCTFTAVLTVTDGPLDRGGKSDTDSVVIQVGNSVPVVNITYTALQGLSPLTVTFNAKNSTDAENDPLEVEWIWDDPPTPNETYKAKTGKTPPGDGSVPHTFTLPAGATSKTFAVKAIVYDLKADGSRKGGATTWPGVEVTVFRVKPPPSGPNSPPEASFKTDPREAFVGKAVNFDASDSTDRDGGELRYRWVFGDGSLPSPFTTNPRTTHTYTSPGSYLVRLTVRDEDNASTDATQTMRVVLPGENRTPVAMIATGPRAGSAPLTLTFDGSISFDPDGDPITSYLWQFLQNGTLIEEKTGPTVTRVFSTPGEFTVVLVVRDRDVGDDEGLEGRSEPQSILVTESSSPPPPEPPPSRPEPEEPPDSAAQRPFPRTCGMGMLMSMFGSLLGLRLTVATRRRLKA